MQGLPAEERAEEEPVGPKGATNLCERARYVVDRVECANVDD